jgi:hypothetical protein
MDSVSDKHPGVPDWTDALQAGKTYTLEQIVNEARIATQASLDYCNGEMTNCLERITELERREALLTEGYLAYEADWYSEHPVWSEEGAHIEARLEAARSAIADGGFPWTEEAGT